MKYQDHTPLQLKQTAQKLKNSFPFMYTTAHNNIEYFSWFIENVFEQPL